MTRWRQRGNLLLEPGWWMRLLQLTCGMTHMSTRLNSLCGDLTIFRQR
jgi:hypothetical protein